MPIEFLSPRDVVFTCSECADCCRSLNVPVGEAERLTLEALSWEGLEDRLVGARATVRVSGQEGSSRRLPRNDDGSCTYLGEDGLCLIHRHFGAGAKPSACRVYPFSFHRVGEAVAVDCAFSCSAVSKGEGQVLQGYQAEWVELIAGGASSDSLSYRLSGRKKLSPELAATFQGFLERFLSDRELSIPQRLRRCLQFSALATSGDPEGPLAETLRDAIAKGLSDKESEDWRNEGMDETQEAIFFQWLFLALNPPSPNVDVLASSAKDKWARQRVRAAQAYREEGGRPLVDDRQLEVSFADVLKVDSSFLDGGEASALVERFLLAKLTGQRFLLAGTASLAFTEAVPKFLLSYPMLAWTAKALAADAGRAALVLQDVQGAIRLVDRSLGQVATSRLPKKQARVCDFVMLETDLVLAAATTVRRA